MLKDKEIADKILQGFNEVYNEPVSGFLESTYEYTLAIVQIGCGLQVDQQIDIAVDFRGYKIGDFRADLAVNQNVIVE